MQVFDIDTDEIFGIVRTLVRTGCFQVVSFRYEDEGRVVANAYPPSPLRIEFEVW